MEDKKYLKEMIGMWVSEADAYEDVEITIKCTKSAAEESLLKLISYIRANGGPGHSFSIIVDPDGDTGQTQRFGFDGDGSDAIREIWYKGKKVEWKDYE